MWNLEYKVMKSQNLERCKPPEWLVRSLIYSHPTADPPLKSRIRAISHSLLNIAFNLMDTRLRDHEVIGLFNPSSLPAAPSLALPVFVLRGQELCLAAIHTNEELERWKPRTRQGRSLNQSNEVITFIPRISSLVRRTPTARRLNVMKRR